MIVFACKQCGKRFERPETASGTLVFCSCGAGNTIPWESAWTEPEGSALPPAAVPIPAAPLASPWHQWERPQPAIRQRNSAYCFNHQDTLGPEACAQCGEKFCGDCVVVFQGRTLCGPCKNFFLHSVQRPPRISIAAIFAPLVALLTAPPATFLLFMIAGIGAAQNISGNQSQGFTGLILAFGFLGLLVQLVAFGLGAYSLRNIEAGPQISGRALAITGMVAAVVCATLFGEIALLVIRMVE